MVYTSEFAARFSLPAKGVQPLDAGLYALVVRVFQPAGDAPLCYLDLYLDDKLELAFPEGSEGIRSRSDEENPTFFIRDSSLLGPEDHRWDERLGSYHAVACRTDAKNCLQHESGPAAFSRHLLPDVAFQSYFMPCPALDPKHAPTEMWILRQGRKPTELWPQAKDDSATYRFAIPNKLLELASPHTHQATRFYEEHALPRELPRGRFTVPGGPSKSTP